MKNFERGAVGETFKECSDLFSHNRDTGVNIIESGSQRGEQCSENAADGLHKVETTEKLLYVLRRTAESVRNRLQRLFQFLQNIRETFNFRELEIDVEKFFGGLRKAAELFPCGAERVLNFVDNLPQFFQTGYVEVDSGELLQLLDELAKNDRCASRKSSNSFHDFAERAVENITPAGGFFQRCRIFSERAGYAERTTGKIHEVSDER